MDASFLQKRFASKNVTSMSAYSNDSFFETASKKDDVTSTGERFDGGSTSGLNFSAGTGETINRKELLERQYSSRKLASMGDDMDKSISSLSVNTGNGKTMLRNELLARRSSLTVREVSFLNELIQSPNINAAQLQQVTKVLGDSNLFFDCDEQNANLSKSSPARMNCQLKSSTKRLSALNFRRSSSIHSNLWHLHENGISTNSALSRRSSYCASRSFRSFSSRDLFGSHGNIVLNPKLSKATPPVTQTKDTLMLLKCSNEQIQEKSKLNKKGACDSVARNLSLVTQLGTLEEEESYRFYSFEGAKEQQRDEVDNDNEGKKSPIIEDQHQLSDLKGSDNSDWWEKSDAVQSKDSLIDVVRESCEAAASLPVVLRSYAGISTYSRMNSIPSIRLASALRSSSSMWSLDPSEVSSSNGCSSPGKASFASIHRARPVRSLSSNSSIRSNSFLSLDDIDIERSFRRTGLAPIAFPPKPTTSVFRPNLNSIRRISSSGRQVSFKGTPQSFGVAIDLEQVRPNRRLITREASVSAYAGEGFEVMDPVCNDEYIVSSHPSSLDQITNKLSDVEFKAPPAEDLRLMPALFHSSESNLENSKDFSRRLARDKSEGTVSAVERIWWLDGPKEVIDMRGEENDISWDLDDDDEKDGPPLDVHGAWQVVNDDSILGMGYRGAESLSFLILGTSAKDESAQPHVLSPPLMESLRSFLPSHLLDTNFWLKYSLLRDGSSLTSLLQHVRGSKYTILAIETVEGEVFGSFTSAPWRKTWGFFGSGQSFLWRMRGSRASSCMSVLDQARRESEIEVFPWTGENDMIQICRTDIIAVGGGTDEANGHASGFGIALESDLLRGSTGPCLTFGSPRLCRHGDYFEAVNVEVWSFTPFATEAEAQKLELTQLFLEGYDQ